MSLPLRFNSCLPADLHNVMAFYERESGASLANALYDELMKRIAQVQENPKQFSFSVGDRKRVKLERFPYHFLYRFKPNCVRVLVLRHHKRNPNYGMRRL